MKKRKMYIRMIMASLLRRRSRMIIALLAISIGAMILSGLVTIYYDVPRQMGQQFRSYGANMILTSEGDSITQEQVEATKKLIPEDKLVGVAAYRYQTVRINDRPVMAAAADLEQVRKTSPFWLVEGEWPSKEGELMAGKNIARTYCPDIVRLICWYRNTPRIRFIIDNCAKGSFFYYQTFAFLRLPYNISNFLISFFTCPSLCFLFI